MKKLRLLVCTMLLCMCSIIPAQASEAPVVMNQEVFEIEVIQENSEGTMSIWNNFLSINLNYGFDSSKKMYYSMSVSPYDHTSYFTGMLRLYDASGKVLAIESVRDTDAPYTTGDFTYQAVSGMNYQIGFTGYVYMTPGGHGEYVDVRSSWFNCD
ncbi:MAG: hypothetical protein R3Y47_03240 [Lachnospiraceae bacterium]